MISDLAARLSRMAAFDGYHLERAHIESVDDALYWLRDWSATGGHCVWTGRSDAERRRAVKHWLFLRALNTRQWRERGGRDV